MLGRVLLASVLMGAICSSAQTTAAERSFPQSRAAVEKALKNLQANMAGRLPALEGFANPADHPLKQYQRGYYQSNVEVRSSPSGGSIVRVTAKVTAWYADPNGSHSGYQLLTSNGRLESDLFDELAEQLAATASDDGNKAGPPVRVANEKSAIESTPASKSPEPLSEPSMNPAFNSRIQPALPDRVSDSKPDTHNADQNALQAEADSLEEAKKNIAHPKNLVAVKKSGTPVVSTPSLTAKPEFLASMHDEFELLDFNADWVHVRVSGLSRGWIWRNSVEMPEGIAETAAPAASTLTPAADLFHVMREENAQFPGDWEPLRSKNVKIISVQKLDESSKDAGAKERLEYAKFLFEKSYKEMGQAASDVQGIVVIFDSSDGGMIAATTSTLQLWIAGTLSDAALWHKCFFDPPETFDSSGASASR